MGVERRHRCGLLAVDRGVGMKPPDRWTRGPQRGHVLVLVVRHVGVGEVRGASWVVERRLVGAVDHVAGDRGAAVAGTDGARRDPVGARLCGADAGDVRLVPRLQIGSR